MGNPRAQHSGGRFLGLERQKPEFRSQEPESTSQKQHSSQLVRRVAARLLRTEWRNVSKKRYPGKIVPSRISRLARLRARLRRALATKLSQRLRFSLRTGPT